MINRPDKIEEEDVTSYGHSCFITFSTVWGCNEILLSHDRAIFNA